jgi:AcrR family transcriptional regulator
VTTTPRRTQADRSATTRRALIRAARELFTEHGYAAVGTERIATEAGVTRGALYHQFADKVELFAAVMETVEVELMVRLAKVTPSSDDPRSLLLAGADAWLDASVEPEVQRIVLLDGPAVLGWERWRDIGLRYGLGLVATILADAMAAGTIPTQPVDPLAHALVGALDEAALYVARADDPATAREEMGIVVHRLVDGLLR